MTPDFATKLGASYGAFLKKGSTVVTSRDTTLVCRMLKRALAGGPGLGRRQRAGQREHAAADLAPLHPGQQRQRRHPRPIWRPTSRISLQIEFFDKNGIYLSTNGQRKIETIFYREDFGRTSADEVGTINYVPRAVEQYSQDFFARLNTEAVRRRGFRVVVDYAYSRIAGVLPGMLGQLEAETIALNGYTDAAQGPEDAVRSGRGSLRCWRTSC